MSKCERGNCPFYPYEINDPLAAWGGSEEFFEALRERHIKEHLSECPTCERPYES